MTPKDYAYSIAGGLIMLAMSVFVILTATLLGVYSIIGWLFTLPTKRFPMRHKKESRDA